MKILNVFAFLIFCTPTGCFDSIDPVKPVPMDGGAGGYATWGVFTPGTGTSDNAENIDKLFGPPNGDLLHLGIGGSVDVTFSDRFIYNIVDHSDIRIHGSFDPGEKGLVYGSEDGADFHIIGDVTGDNPTIDIARGGLTRILFLRIRDGSLGDGIEIDAIEAIHSQ